MPKSRSFMLTYDVPRGLVKVETKAWRDLNKIKARKLQHSLWSHSDLNKLIKIATYIKNNGGHARILEERFLF